jgi:hypothetical protein
LIDFRFLSHRTSTTLRCDVSRQQSRGFNDLRGQRVPNSATAFDNRRRIVLKEKIPLTKGRLPEASREVERGAVPAGGFAIRSRAALDTVRPAR